MTDARTFEEREERRRKEKKKREREREGERARARAGAGRSLAFLLPTQGMAQLAVKVLSLTVKTASKPLANQFQAYMLSHPFVRGKAIEGAQVLHKWNVSLSRASQVLFN